MKRVLQCLMVGIPVLVVITGIFFFSKYNKSNTMIIPIEEVSREQYPDDPSYHSLYYGKYGNRYLRLVKVDDKTFDFIFESKDPDVSTVVFRDIDLSLIVPIQPSWTKGNSDLETITFVEREWNRQQFSFDPNSKHVKILNGNGYERDNIVSLELARNCLNAGLWEVLLYTKEDNKKTLLYQGWFNFPLGHYKDIFEKYNDVSYWKHWYRLEHWFDPEGTVVDLNKLRTVVNEKEVSAAQHSVDNIIANGEQLRKKKTTKAEEVECWGDICEKSKNISYATFVPPGRYIMDKPWGNEYERIDTLEKAVVRKVKSPGSARTLDEVELVFKAKDGEQHRFIVSGITLSMIPRLDTKDYSKGLYMPMGISVPPFYQSYDELKKNPPQYSPYFSVLMNGDDEWINHHDVAVDGPVIHRDRYDSRKFHIYFLSYERHSLVGHYTFKI